MTLKETEKHKYLKTNKIVCGGGAFGQNTEMSKKVEK